MPVEILEFRDEEKRSALKSSTRQSVCILPISVGQEYHQDSSWDQTVQLVNENFSACIIVVVDELHRFTEEMKLPYEPNATEDQIKQKQEKARYIAIESGKTWVGLVQARWEGVNVPDKMKPHIPRFSIPYAITYWNHWTQNDAYAIKKSYIDRMYNLAKAPIDQNNCLSEFNAPLLDGFHTSVEKVVLTFVEGFLRNVEKESTPTVEFDVTRAAELSREYVLEELAMVEMCRAHQLPEKALSEEIKSKISSDTILYMAYFFGQNSTNKRVFECFGKFCSDKFKLLNLVKSDKQHHIQKKPQAPAPLILSEAEKVVNSGGGQEGHRIIGLQESDRNSLVDNLAGAPDRSTPGETSTEIINNSPQAYTASSSTMFKAHESDSCIGSNKQGLTI